MSGTQPDAIAVAVLAAHTVVRAGLQHAFKAQNRLLMVGDAITVEDAVSLATAQKVDVTVLDPDSASVPLQAVAALHRAGSRVLVLTATPDIRLHQRALELGATGVVSKDQSMETLVRAIEKVHAGEIWLGRDTAAGLLTAVFTPRDPNQDKIQTLTKRERQIVALVGNGLKNADIGSQLFISASTVRNHLTSILSKLELTDRFELAVYAFRHGLVRFDRPFGTSDSHTGRLTIVPESGV